MSEATRLQHLQHAAIEAVNAIVECRNVSFEERHDAIELVRQHLEARAEQTKIVTTNPWLTDAAKQKTLEALCALDNSDLL